MAIINGTGTGNTIEGTNQSDKINAGNGGDVVDAGKGNDAVQAGGGRDSVVGGNGDDTINGGDNKDNVNGNDGGDQVRGGQSQDTVKGGTGNDFVDGGGANDEVYGGDGSDYIRGGNGRDLLYGTARSNGDNDIDYFAFDNRDGDDTVFNFEVGIDKIHLSDGGSAADVTFSYDAGSGNTIMTYGQTTVKFKGVDLTTADQTYLFAADTEINQYGADNFGDFDFWV